MDDSDIVILDDSLEEQSSTIQNVFSIASPAVCQRWTRPSSADQTPQTPQRQRTLHSSWLNTFNTPFNYQPQPVITSVTSLSPQRNRPITITEVKSLSPMKPSTLNGYEPKYQSSKKSSPPSSYRICQPIITRVESLSPLKNQQKIIGSGTVSISHQKYEPECIVLDDDESNISLTSIRTNASTDFNNFELKDIKTEQTGTGCERNLSMISCESNSFVFNEPVEEKPTTNENCERKMTEDPSDKSNQGNTNNSTIPTTNRKRIRPTAVSQKVGAPEVAVSETLRDFKNACLAAADNEKDMRTILENKLDKSFNNASPAFKKSSSFHALLLQSLNKVQSDPTNVYVHISQLITELKARKVSKEEAEEPPKKKMKSNSKGSKTVDYVALENARDELKMKKLSKTLGKLQKMIKKLECKEVNWEDEDDSSYIMLQRYKQRAVKVFHKLCEYTKESTSAGKINKIHLPTGTCFPEVNKCVEQFVNSTGQFPDFCDMLELIKESNIKHNMKLQEYELEDMAKKVFEEVGGELQKQRKHGVAESLLVFMEEENRDPAEDSIELKEKLSENAKHWKKITEIIDDFAMRAKEKKGNESGESKTDDEEEGGDDEDEEEEEEEEESDKEDDDEDLEKIVVPDILKSDNEDNSEKSDNDVNSDDESNDLKEPVSPGEVN